MALDSLGHESLDLSLEINLNRFRNVFTTVLQLLKVVFQSVHNQ